MSEKRSKYFVSEDVYYKYNNPGYLCFEITPITSKRDNKLEKIAYNILSAFGNNKAIVTPPSNTPIETPENSNHILFINLSKNRRKIIMVFNTALIDEFSFLRKMEDVFVKSGCELILKEDKRKLVFSKSIDAVTDKTHEGYQLFADNPDNYEYWDEFCAVCLDIMEFFSKNRVVIFTSSYRKIKNEKKKLFLNSYTEPEFEVGTANNDLKKKLSTKTDVVFADIVTTLPTKSSLNSIKHLCIMQRRLDRQLLIDVLSANDKHAFFDFTVCLQSEVVRYETDKETVEKAWTKDFYVNLILDTDYPRLHIVINPQYIDRNFLEDELCKIIKKHNKYMEISL